MKRRAYVSVVCQLLALGAAVTLFGCGPSVESDGDTTESLRDSGTSDAAADTDAPEDDADPDDPTDGGADDDSGPTDTGPADGGSTDGGTDEDGGSTDTNTNSDTDGTSGPVEGEIQGESWIYTSGSAVVTNQSGSGDGTLEVSLYAGPSDPCSVNAGNYDGWKITTTLPATEKRHTLQISGGDTRTVKFEKIGNTVVADQGFIEISSLGDSTVEGVMDAKKSATNHLTGTFEATRCDN